MNGKKHWWIPAIGLAAALSGCEEQHLQPVDPGFSVGAAIAAQPSGSIVVVSPENNLRPVPHDLTLDRVIDIDFELPMLQADLSLCSDYLLSGTGGVRLNEASCMFHSTTTTGLISHMDLVVSTEVTTLLAVVIDQANPTVPYFRAFAVDPGTVALQWFNGQDL